MAEQKKHSSLNQWHYREYLKNFLGVDYVEWKYFNFTSGKYSGIFVYSLTDPLNLTGRGGARVLGRVFISRDVQGGAEKFAVSDADFSLHSADAAMGKNSIKVFANGAYEIRGEVESLGWNLRYTPLVLPIKSFSDRGMVPLHIERASWCIEMPRAKVEGFLTWEGKKIPIEGFGYADANWGSPIPLLTAFNWAQYSDGAMALVMGEIQNIEVGKIKLGHWAELYIRYGDELITFAKKELRITHTEWARVPQSYLEVPMRTEVSGENNEYALMLALETEVSDPLFFELPFHIPVRPIIVEQLTRCFGELRVKAKSGARPLHAFSGRGFKEYTLRDIALRKKNKAGILIK